MQTLAELSRQLADRKVTSRDLVERALALIADPADLTTPFSALPTGASFGVGFNPVPDLLRVIASNGSNLRINPNPNGSSQCLVTTDTAITASWSHALPAAARTSSSLGLLHPGPVKAWFCPRPRCGPANTSNCSGPSWLATATEIGRAHV